MEELRPASLQEEAAASLSIPPADPQRRPSASATAIHFSNATRDQPLVSTYTIGVLQEVVAGAGVEKIQILSAYRTVEEQARFIYRAMHHLKPTFPGHAGEVERVAKSMIGQIQLAMKAGPEARLIPTTADILKRMTEAIEGLEHRHGPLAISSHRHDPNSLAVLNIGLNVGGSIQRAALFRQLSRCSAISRVGAPRSVRGIARSVFNTVGQWIHIEIPQR